MSCALTGGVKNGSECDAPGWAMKTLRDQAVVWRTAKAQPFSLVRASRRAIEATKGGRVSKASKPLSGVTTKEVACVVLPPLWKVTSGCCCKFLIQKERLPRAVLTKVYLPRWAANSGVLRTEPLLYPILSKSINPTGVQLGEKTPRRTAGSTTLLRLRKKFVSNVWRVVLMGVVLI